MTTHEGAVSYTLHDDGVWLICSCGWQVNLGYSPSVEEISASMAKHQETVDPGTKPPTLEQMESGK